MRAILATLLVTVLVFATQATAASQLSPSATPTKTSKVEVPDTATAPSPPSKATTATDVKQAPCEVTYSQLVGKSVPLATAKFFKSIMGLAAFSGRCEKDTTPLTITHIPPFPRTSNDESTWADKVEIKAKRDGIELKGSCSRLVLAQGTLTKYKIDWVEATAGCSVSATTLVQIAEVLAVSFGGKDMILDDAATWPLCTAPNAPKRSVFTVLRTGHGFYEPKGYVFSGGKDGGMKDALLSARAGKVKAELLADVDKAALCQLAPTAAACKKEPDAWTNQELAEVLEGALNKAPHPEGNAKSPCVLARNFAKSLGAGDWMPEGAKKLA